jgi:Mg2+ and Co2+ transporter CorA
VDNTAIQQQYIIETLQQASEAMKKLADAIMEALKPVIEAFKRWAKALWDKLMKAAAMNANPKWWHYYKHSKSKRIRKKYQTRIRDYLMKLLIEGSKP